MIYNFCMENETTSKFDRQQLLYRIDERVSFLASDFSTFKNDIHRLIVDMESKFVSSEEFKPVKNDLNKFVSKDEFEPVKLIVYGLVSIIMIAVVTALLALIIIKN